MNGWTINFCYELILNTKIVVFIPWKYENDWLNCTCSNFILYRLNYARVSISVFHCLLPSHIQTCILNNNHVYLIHMYIKNLKKSLSQTQSFWSNACLAFRKSIVFKTNCLFFITIKVCYKISCVSLLLENVGVSTMFESTILNVDYAPNFQSTKPRKK